MSEPGFEELQKLWQSPATTIAPAYRIILRQRRWRWLARLYLVAEIACTIGGIPLAIWLALQPRTLLPGIGLLLLILFAAGASLWARSIRRARIEDPLLASLDEGVRRARIGVRFAYAGLWVLAASLFFVAGMGFIWMSSPNFSEASARRIIVAMIVWCGWFGLWLVFSIPYLAHRSRELAQMERARDEMNGHS
jgi:hypothetical protein